MDAVKHFLEVISTPNSSETPSNQLQALPQLPLEPVLLKEG